MFKTIAAKIGNGITKSKKAVVTASLAVSAFAMAAVPTFAATTNPDLDAVTQDLVGGANDMKTNALTIIGVCITIFIVVFGISWLMSIFKKKMSKAS